LEFNVPFQHKYGYIRDEISFEGGSPGPRGCVSNDQPQRNCIKHCLGPLLSPTDVKRFSFIHVTLFLLFKRCKKILPTFLFSEKNVVRLACRYLKFNEKHVRKNNEIILGRFSFSELINQNSHDSGQLITHFQANNNCKIMFRSCKLSCIYEY